MQRHNIVMSFFKKIKSCTKVCRPGPGPATPPATSGESRNRNKNMFLNYLEKSLYAQLLLAAEIEYFSSEIQRIPDFRWRPRLAPVGGQ